MLYSARCRLSAEEKARLSSLLSSKPIDWKYLMDAATRHGVLPLLFRSLNSLPEPGVRGAELRRIGWVFMHNAVRCRALSAELLHLLDLLGSQAIQAVPYKGPALSAMVYGDMAMRMAGDLDILVQPSDAKKGVEILLADGFRLHRRAIGRAKLDLRHEYHLELASDVRRPPVELHWHFCNDLDFRPDLSQWWGRLIPLELEGRTVRIMPHEETLVTLCVHAAKELLNRMLLVADIAELIRTRPELDWQRILELAATPDVRRILRVCLLLARELMEVDLPPDISSFADADSAAWRLAHRVAKRLTAGSTTVVRPPERIPFALAVRSRPRERTKYLASYIRVLLTPNDSDISYVRIPDSLSFLYYLVRPVRRLLWYLSAAWEKLIGR
jgi:hypothetical protein